jgi:hypothetical protein
METYMQILQKKLKNQQLFMDLHAGIAMDVEKSTTTTRSICGYYNGCKKSTTIMRPICEYCIFEMALWKL